MGKIVNKIDQITSGTSQFLLSETDIDRVVEMAWEDRTPFDAIKTQFNLNESQVKALMQKKLKFSSYKLWRKRVESCKTKHKSKRTISIKRFKSKLQRTITSNKISKRGRSKLGK